MTVIRAPPDDDEDVQPEAAPSGVRKVVSKGINYIRSVLGMRRRRRRRKKGLRLPPGTKLSRNPFFNYLRHLNVELRGMSASEVAQEGGRRWRLMSDWDKQPYRDMARRAQRVSRRSKSSTRSISSRSRRSRSRSVLRSRRRSRSRSRSRSRPSRARRRGRRRGSVF